MDELGIHAQDITFVAFAVGYLDYIGHARHFRKRTCSANARNSMLFFGPNPKKYDFISELYASMSSNLRDLLEDDQGLLVRRWLSSALRPTPGHTPGHQPLFGRLPHSGPVILSRDAAHSQDNLAHPCAPRVQRRSHAGQHADRQAPRPI